MLELWETELVPVIECDVVVEFSLVVVDEENIFVSPLFVGASVIVVLLLVFVEDANMFVSSVPVGVLVVVAFLPVAVVLKGTVIDPFEPAVPADATMIDCMCVDDVAFSLPTATIALKGLNSAIFTAGAAAGIIYISRRLPAPQYSSLLPGHRKLQSVCCGTLTLPALRVLPQ